MFIKKLFVFSIPNNQCPAAILECFISGYLMPANPRPLVASPLTVVQAYLSAVSHIVKQFYYCYYHHYYNFNIVIIVICWHCQLSTHGAHISITAVFVVFQELPVNVKFVIEGMEETGSNGLDVMIVAQRDTFFSDVDYIIISDCGWLSRRPALTYGTRGNCYFTAEVLFYQSQTLRSNRKTLNAWASASTNIWCGFFCTGSGTKTRSTLWSVWRCCDWTNDRPYWYSG